MNPPTQPHKIYTLDTMIDFGKYKGKTVRQLVAADPEYAWWAKENVRNFRLDQVAADALDDAMLDFTGM